MTNQEVNNAVQKAIASGLWMIRTDDNGVSYKGFQWAPVGEWTYPDRFSKRPVCRDGLFGQTREASGFPPSYHNVVFCETGPWRVVVDGDKIKTDKARVLLRNDLSAAIGLVFEGSLHLSGCTSLTHLPEGLEVEEDLILNGCRALTHLPERLKVGGGLHLYRCRSLIHIPESLKVGGELDLRGCISLTHLSERLNVGATIYGN